MSHNPTNIVRQLITREVPEILIGDVQIKAIARAIGYRCKVAVHAVDESLDVVGVCVGVRGSRIKKVVDALDGERIDLVRWNDDLKVLIANSLQPGEVEAVVLDEDQRRATVFVAADQHALVLGRRGVNVSLARELCGYDIVIETT